MADGDGSPPRGRGRSRPPNEGTSDATPPNSDPFIAAAREQAQLTFKRRTDKAKKAVKAASDALRLTTMDMIVARRREVVEKQAWRLGLFVKRGALEWAHALDTVVKIAKTFLRQTDAERAHWTYIVESQLKDAFVKGPSLSDEDAGLIEPVKPELGDEEERPGLKVDRLNPEITVAQMRGILGQGGLFDRGKVVKIVIDPTKGGAAAHEMTAPALVIAVHESARPYVETRYSDGSTRKFPAALPDAIATKYLDYRDWGLPPLAGITSAPLLAEDGSIRTALGYDILTGMWCENIPDVADLVPAKPTKDDAARALAVVRETFQTFPFADASAIDAGKGVRTVDLKKPPGLDESAFLCSLMTGVCRPCLWLAPATVVHGPQMSGAGVGKGLLVRSMFQIAFGRQPHAVARAATAEEQEKRIATELIEAGPSIFLDNFNNLTFKSASLESALTERTSRVRDFGKLRSVTLNTVAFIAITGNGLIISQDLVRRVIEIHLDAFMEHPEQRQFAVKDDDFIAAVGKRRTELLVALLTIWRWGRQNHLATGLALGSYGQWCSWVRDPLLALDCTDPVERIAANKQRDPWRQSIMQIFDAWRKYHGDHPVAVADLHDEVRYAIDPQKRGRQYRTAFLAKLAGTRTGGYVLTQQLPAGKWGVTTYRLESADGRDMTPDQPPPWRQPDDPDIPF
ncbi:MAG TPA: hypothetical protein VFE60_09205 [Roseiarcus sp.]|jgi:hypothetical protein|nr:hypothetical protein [Roseiarcus sp.]